MCNYLLMEYLRQRLARLMREKMRTSMVDTQVKVAAKAGISQSTVQRLLSQDQSATLDLLEQLSKAFSVARPHHLLLEQDEANILTLWEGLDEADRATVIGFLQIKSQANKQSLAPLSFADQMPVAHQLRAASDRAASKPNRPGLSSGKRPDEKSSSARRKA